MIFVFHIAVHIIHKAFNSLYEMQVSEDCWDAKLWNLGETFYLDGLPRLHFMPQCYIQRYAAVCNVLSHERCQGSIRKVVDLGCAELGFFLHVKNIDGVEDYTGVDIDLDLVTRCCCKISPQMYDCLYGVRKSPLTARVYCGSATDYDPCLKSTDAVVCIELIEHLHPEILEKLPENVFKRIRPRLAIFTTPNSEFNVLFSDFSGMRHPDHKFEWTRQEFQDWALNVVREFPEYSVKLHGICPPPKGREEVGCCSQMAVFRREVDLNPYTAPEDKETYKLIREAEYPFTIDVRTDAEKVVQEVRYRFFRLASAYDDEVSDSGRSRVPLEDFLPFVADFCPTLDKLRETLETEGWQVNGTEKEPWISLPDEDSDSFVSLSEGCKSLNNSVIVNPEDDLWTDGDETVLCENQIDDGIVKETYDSKLCTETKTNGFAHNHPPEDFVGSFFSKNQHKRGWSLVENEDDVERFSANEQDGKVEWVSPCYSSTGESLTVKIGCCNGSQKTSDKSWGQVSSVEVARYESDESEGEVAGSVWRTIGNGHARCGQRSSRLAKSFSLDSCLENINCERAEVQAMYLSMHSRARTLESGSPSERGPDSGYPISFSQDLSEQPDLATSDDSLSEGEDVPPMRPRPQNPLPLVENGDVANNNRDGEGNNVEGVRNPLPPPFLLEDFPPWLLHLLMDPQPIPPRDEGLGDDSGSECSDSPAGSIE